MIRATGHSPSRVARQALVGVFCFGLNLVLMWALVAVAQLPVLAATAICFFALNAVGHHLSRRHVFPDAGNPYHHSFARFLAVMATSLALNLAAMAIATKWLDLHYLLASTCIAALFFFANYLAHRHWTFR